MKSTCVGCVHIAYFFGFRLNYALLCWYFLGYRNVGFCLNAVPATDTAFSHVERIVVIGSNCNASFFPFIDFLEQYSLLFCLHLHAIKPIDRDLLDLLEIVESLCQKAVVETLQSYLLQKLVYFLIVC